MRSLARLAAFLALSAPLPAQLSQHALRFHGTGANQLDRLRIAIDDDLAGADASSPCDVGAQGFTIELWVRGLSADNPTSSSGAQGSYADARWTEGHMLVDRDIWGGSERDFGISLAGGCVRFGTGRGDGPAQDADNTLEGDTQVLDGAWHHVACVRDAASGRKRIYVDAVLDIEGPAGVSQQDLSYPDAGVSGAQSPWGPYLVLGAEKHDAGAAFPSFDGFLDELRVWNVARTRAAIGSTWDRHLPASTPGLVGRYRFEEGAGTLVADTSGAGAAAGELLPGAEWVAFAQSPSSCAPIAGDGLPSGFTRTTLTTQLAQPTALECLADGRIFIAELGGALRVVANGSLLAPPLVQLPADTQNGERGLLGMALDPAFAANGFLYLFWTTTEPRNRVSRLTVVGNSAALASELVLWQSPEPALDYHHGGCLGFGLEGALYVATGDRDDSANAQSLANVHGKILRLNADGSIPATNPFTSTPGARPEIWAYGLRNPFRFAFDAQSGALWIGDVGGNGFESWEELQRGVAGANYGWPNQEGPECYSGSCGAYRFPEHAYRHNDPLYAPALYQGSVIAGPVYRATQFPAALHGNLFYADYANRWIRRLVLDGAGAVAGDVLFDSAPDAGTIVDLEAGPDGALWYLSFGTSWSGTPDVAGLHAIRWTGATNLPPVPVASAAPTSGALPLSVQFTGSGSHDPDQGPSSLTYAWEFGDSTGSNAADPLHVYTVPGIWSARLTVFDGGSVATSPWIDILAGNAPQPVILAPPVGSTYRAGDVIAFSGSASDVEDGALAPSALRWEVLLVHSGHTHPFLGPLPGVASGSFTIPTTGHGPANTHYQIVLTATDSDGLATTRTRDLEPVISNLVLGSQPPGIPIFLDGEPLTTPSQYPSVPGHVHTSQAQPLWTGPAGSSWVFRRWSNGTTSHSTSWAAPEGGGTLRAIYARLVTTTVSVSVPAVARNAEHSPTSGQTAHDLYDLNGICCGRDAAGALQMGFEFPLAIPRGATIVSARLEFTPTNDQSPAAPAALVRAYDVGDAPPFLLGGANVPLSAHAPLGAPALSWELPAFVSGQVQSSPELAELLQAIVVRPDWHSGQHAGFVLDGTPTRELAWRCVRNFASGQPPRLVVTWGLPLLTLPRLPQ